MKKIVDYVPEMRSAYIPHKRVQYTGELVNPVTGEISFPPSMTKQEHKAECDINNVVAQYKRTGMISHISAKAAQGAYQDLPDPMDYQEALHIQRDAAAAFASLPSKVRDRFANDPAEFLTFMADPQNAQEARELGLLNPATPPTPPSPDPSQEPKKEP